MGNYSFYQMVSATLTKVREIKHAADARPVVLLGWGVGAAIAAHVAGMERLAGLVSSSVFDINVHVYHSKQRLYLNI